MATPHLGMPILGQVDKLALYRTNPRHLDTPLLGATTGSGAAIADFGKKVGAEQVMGDGSFDDMMLRALDKVSGDQRFADELAVAAITEPGSVDTHDITIAQAKAQMSLGVARTVLSRVVQGWRDLINTR